MIIAVQWHWFKNLNPSSQQSRKSVDIAIVMSWFSLIINCSVFDLYCRQLVEMCRVYNFIIRVKTIYILSLMGQTGSQTSLDNPGPCVVFSITQIIDFSYTRHFVGAHGWVPSSHNNHNHNILCIDLEREISCHRRTAINNGGQPSQLHWIVCILQRAV